MRIVREIGISMTVIALIVTDKVFIDGVVDAAVLYYLLDMRVPK